MDAQTYTVTQRYTQAHTNTNRHKYIDTHTGTHRHAQAFSDTRAHIYICTHSQTHTNRRMRRQPHTYKLTQAQK